MSDKGHISPGVDTTLLKTHFAVVTDAVGALRFPAKYNKFLPTVNRVLSFSSFFGFTSHNILLYETFFISWDLCFENENICICPFHSSDTLG